MADAGPAETMEPVCPVDTVAQVQATGPANTASVASAQAAAKQVRKPCLREKRPARALREESSPCIPRVSCAVPTSCSSCAPARPRSFRHATTRHAKATTHAARPPTSMPQASASYEPFARTSANAQTTDADAAAKTRACVHMRSRSSQAPRAHTAVSTAMAGASATV